MDIESGKAIGEWVIERKLGAGSFGEVWSALHAKTSERAAIKSMRKGTGSDLIGRFKREAAGLERVRSEHVGRFIDFIVQEQDLFIVMEFIEGDLLSDVLFDTALGMHEVLELGIHLAKGLVDLHAAGIIHRDIKPSNIILRPLGNGRQRGVIFDLGLSRFLPGSGGGDEVTATASKVAIGTPGYMAPEQILDARNAVASSDIYGLGMVLYRASCGRLPFTGTDVEIVRKKLLEEAPRLDLGRVDQVREKFCDLIAKCIRRRGEERYQAANDVLVELMVLREKLLSEPPMRSMSPYPGSMSPYPGSISPPPGPISVLPSAPQAPIKGERGLGSFVVMMIGMLVAVAVLIALAFYALA
jgi:serine/threonine protein kinase